MRSVARMELVPGMVLGEDIVYQNKVVYAKNTVIDEVVIERLKRYSVICVSIMEDIDFATTHYEKIRFNEDFKLFEKKHAQNIVIYKILMKSFMETFEPIRDESLISIHDDIADTYNTGAELLDFLYNLMPNEDELTFNHCLNSALLAGVFAQWMHLSEKDTRTLILACFYYDIGKLKLPYEILWKPGKLTNEEYATIKKHPAIGHTLVRYTSLSEKIKDAVLMHHERMDGSGYPQHLQGDEIHYFARYIAIIDTYIAMASPRSYRPAMTPLQILGHFETNLEKYDTEILMPIMQKIGDAQLGTTVQLNDDSIWEVFILHPVKLSRPILRNENSEVLDLMEHPELEIVKNL